MKRSFIILLGACAITVEAGAQTVRVDVDVATAGAPIDTLLYGINTARWDESLFPGPTAEMLLTADRDAVRKIARSGITLLKYPGGNDADAYIWNDPANSASEMDTDEYIVLCRAVGAEPFITVNFNAPAELAAAWVRYCNVERGYGVKLWEVGDEQWGTWAKGHAPPEVYAAKYRAFVAAMRAVDPTIKVATNVPLGPHPEDWTKRVLRAAADDIDMLTFTFFPQKWGQENDDSLLATVGQFRDLYRDLVRDMNEVLGPERAARVVTVNVGYNSVNHSPGPQTLALVNAIWTADMLGTMAQEGVDIGCFWALHNAFPPRKGDYGYLSSEGKNTPSYSYYAFPLIAPRLRGTMVSSRTSDPRVSSYASRRGKALSLVLINKDPKAAHALSVRLGEFSPSTNVRAAILDRTRRNEPWDGASISGGDVTLRMPPFSVVGLEVVDKDSVFAPENLALRADAAASSISTIGPNFGPRMAIDGLPYTRWNSAAWTKSGGDERQWFSLRWTRPQTITKVVVRWGTTRAVEYSIEVSDDGGHWTPVRTVTGGSGPTDEISLAPVKTRHLRLNGKRGTAGISAYSIREVEVY